MYIALRTGFLSFPSQVQTSARHSLIMPDCLVLAWYPFVLPLGSDEILGGEGLCSEFRDSSPPPRVVVLCRETASIFSNGTEHIVAVLEKKTNHLCSGVCCLFDDQRLQVGADTF